MSGHTPTPWTVHDEFGDELQPGINAGDIKIVHRGSRFYGAGVNGPYWDGRDNAAFIVRAVNAHDDLVEALTEALPWVGHMSDDPSQGLRARIAAALAKATQP